jgi:hypothetical protein
MNIRPSLGNVLFIGLTGLAFGIGAVAAVHYFAPKDIPVLSPTARGLSDFATKAMAA